MPPDLAILSREDVARVLTMDACIVAVREAFRKHGLGEIPPPGVLGPPREVLGGLQQKRYR